MTPELLKKLKEFGISEGDSKEQIIKILSENNSSALASLLSYPSLSADLKKEIEGALNDFASASQAPGPRRIVRVEDALKQELMYQTKDLLRPGILEDIVNSSKPLDEIEMPFSPKNFVRTAPAGFTKFILSNNSEESYNAVLNSKPGDDSLFLSTSVVSSGNADRKSSDFVSTKDKDLAQLQSATKHFTAVLAMRMAENGILDLDEPIFNYFDHNQSGLLSPIQKLNNPPQNNEGEPQSRFFNMSMRDILSHKSGVRHNQDGIFEKTGDEKPNYDSGPFILADLALESAAKKYVQEYSKELPEELIAASRENLTVSALMDSFVLRPPEGSKTSDGKLRPRFDQIFCPKGKKGEDHGIPLHRVMPSFNDANEKGQARESTDGFVNNEGHGGYNHNRGYAMIGSTHDVARFMNELWKEGSILSAQSRKEMLKRSHDTGHGLGTFVTKVDNKYVIGHFGNGLDCLSQASFIATKTQEGLPIDGVALATASTFIANKGLPDLSAMKEYAKKQEQQPSTKKPLIIYVAETDHGDMSYSSLLEKIAKDCDAKGLKSQIFSEFPNQTDKVNTQKLVNVPEQETHLATTEFLNERLIPMGDLKGRGSMYNETFEAVKQYYSDRSSIGAGDMEIYLNEIDDPDALTLVKAHFEEMKKQGTQIPLDQRSFAFYGAIDGPTAIHFKILHEQMAQDVTQKLDPQADVVIMIAGGPHIPGLAAQLDETFRDNEKMVIGNFKEAANLDSPDFDKTAMFTSGSPRSCAAISGKVTEFEVDPKSKLASIPDEVSKTLEEKTPQKQSPQQSPVQKIQEREQGVSKEKSKTTLEEAKAKHTPSIIKKCFNEFTQNKKEREGFKNYIVNHLKLLKSVDEFQKIIDSEDEERFTEIFNQIPFVNLASICKNEGVDIGQEERSIIANTNSPRFYKVEFDENMTPSISPLKDDEIWDQSKGGLDKSEQFILNNAGNSSSLSLFGPALLEKKALEREVASEAKILEKGLRRFDAPKKKRQYLVAINEKSGQENLDLIGQHNSLEGDELRQYSTPFAEQQARSIYLPLIVAEDGKPLPDEEIKNNLSKAASFNPSFGSFSANCQTNALIKLMRDLNINEGTIKQGLESMHRVDAPNMVKIQTGDEKYPSQNAVIFQAPNDNLAIKYGAKLPEKYLTQDKNRDGNAFVITTKTPKEVYHPVKSVTNPKTDEKRKPTEEEIAQENKITTELPKIKTFQEISALGDENKFRGIIKKAIAKIEAQKTLQSRTQSALKDEGLDGFRYSDPNRHNRPHVTEKATPGNEVEGRDPDLLYKMMSDTLNEMEKTATKDTTKEEVSKTLEEKTPQKQSPQQSHVQKIQEREQGMSKQKSKETQKPESFVEKLDLKPKNRESLTAEKKPPESMSYVQKMRAAKDQGKSKDGINEL